MKRIKLDEEVFVALAGKAQGFESVNDVIRRVLGMPPAVKPVDLRRRQPVIAKEDQ